jgi:DNA-binding transcriptional regulator YdaS (Cro superfamily)
MSQIQAAIMHLGNATKLAKALDVTTQAVCFWRDGKREIPADKCPLIERVTDGKVRCEDLRPDVDWQYIRNSACRTAAPASQGQ